MGDFEILLSSEELVQNSRLLFQGTPSALIVLDSEMNVRLWNKAAEKMFIWKKEEVEGQLFPIIPEYGKSQFKMMFSNILNGETLPDVITKRMRKDGSLIDVSVNPHPWRDGNGNIIGYTAIINDLSDFKKIEGELINQQQKVNHLVYFDYLTGLPNRRLFEEVLVGKIAEAKNNQSTVALIFFNIDGFKFINDAIGLGIGDQLLKEVSHRLKQRIGENDFVSRISGDEFSVIISSRDTDKIHHVAQQFSKLFERPFFINGYELFITTSIGISLSPHGENSAQDLIKSADLAMSRAKEEGKNTYEIFSPTLNADTFKRFTLQNDLRKAVREHQIFLHYQPRIDSATNTIVGAEALARWEHPEWGIVSPDEFISLAEESGLINPIGQQLLNLACRQMKKWQESGYSPIKVSVNFSTLQFLQADIVDTVKSVLLETGLDPKWLEIEITETTVMKKEETILLKLAQLRDLGISIAIDDFGTGYSSLSYLKKIKPNTVKIDKSFIQQIPDDIENTEIVTAITKLSEKLRIAVVAEGVETSEQYSYLQSIGCNELQGYLFSKPVPAKEFERLLERRECIPQSAMGIKDFSIENRRQYFRIELPRPLVAEMTITSIGGKKVKLGMTKVLVEDIGPGGIRFVSNIKLPPRQDLVLKIRFFVLEQTIEVDGSIVWSKEADSVQEYGLQFNMSDAQRDKLTGVLNRFQLSLRNKTAQSKSHFLSVSKQDFFNS